MSAKKNTFAGVVQERDRIQKATSNSTPPQNHNNLENRDTKIKDNIPIRQTGLDLDKRGCFCLGPVTPALSFFLS